MTIKTQRVARFGEQGRLLRAVWIVTSQAVAVFEGFVPDVTILHQFLRLVTVVANPAIGPVDLKRVVLGRRLVTGIALAIHHGLMRTGSKQLGLIRTVRVVTNGTGLLFDRITSVGLFKGGIATIMAGDAEFAGGLGQEIWFLRTMSKVALCATAFVDNLMNNVFVVIFLLMALKADGIAFGTQEEIGVGCMGIMTGSACSFFKGCVHSLCI
jgi:hypothetical protein